VVAWPVLGELGAWADASLAGANPRVATRSMIRKIARREWPLARFVDERPGVIFVDYEEDGSVRARRLCDSQLKKRLASLALRIADEDEEQIGCENRPNIECTLGGDHDRRNVVLRFARDPARGLLLDAVLTLTEAGLPQVEERIAPIVERKLAGLRDGVCSP
jgi:hypothetical protein